jgi:hypothetical protein
MKGFVFFLFLILLGVQLHAQPASFLHEMEQDSAVDIYLRLDWKHLEKHKKDKAYQPSMVCCHTQGNDSLSLNAKIRPRGHMRLEICDYPPLKLKIDKDALSKCKLSSMNEVDIVNHCEQNENGDQLLLKEYLAYKLWELVSPNFYKTQLIRLHYQNPDGTQAHETAPAFLLENSEEMVSRLDGRIPQNTIMGNSSIARQPFLKFCLFEFMIGNTDWYIPTRHNIEFIGIPGYQLLVTVPYDFDYSGLVHATYAIPHETLKLPDVAIRYYQGWCHTESEVRGQLQVFLDQKEKILEMPYHIQGLNEKSIRQTVDYLQSFFDIIENPKKLENQVIAHCDLWPVQE